MTTNVYKAFRDLLGTPPLQIGTVQSISGGTAVIQMIDGGITSARGVASVGQRVFFRGNLIEVVAPSLNLELIDV